ncbi:myeloperoxidase [Anoplophora glabripennis]|uniref:myeloperoxidase n=1 Tax=Anoplophora glabripennis TaxID=217634 RepID=UPI000C763A2B|nr:myeloperoxidase [Anoplophora glabripennis]
MSLPSERTRLLPRVNRPDYVFDVTINSTRKKRVKQFQYCMYALLLCIIVVALVATISISINAPEDTNSALNNTETDMPVFLMFTSSLPIPDVDYKNCTTSSNAILKESIQIGKQALKDRQEVEKIIPSVPVLSPSYRHQKIVATSAKARNLSHIGYIKEFATKHFHRRERVCNGSTPIFKEFCENKTIECNVFQKFRTYNGSCNNLKRPGYHGVSYRPFRRSLPPDYADGISKPRASKNGTPLPSARTVSLEVHRPYQKADTKFTVMLAAWGQFLDHDMTATALSQKVDGGTISCCSTESFTHPECFPVELDSSDPFVKYNLTCMEFVRSAPAPTCCLGPREQLNQVTSFIDGSVIYGADEELAEKLRTFVNGTLRMFVTEDERALLPVSEDPSDGCNREEEEMKGRYCFLTGDARANENLHLTSMHLLWARQHNLLASNLSRINPHWDDERIFQEARRIVGAQMQHITYNEFLPALLGKNIMNKFDLSPQTRGYFRKYNESINPSIANNFATAAFRFAHSIIPGLMKFLANDTSSPEYIQMHKMLFDPFKLYEPGEFDRTLRGAMNTSIEASDSYFTNELKSHLFERTSEAPKRCGLDLVSLNIQRGRDHGLPGYSKWRKHCGLNEPTKFDDLENAVDGEALRNIKAVYKNVDDIDLYTGALSERPIKESVLGPTLTCLILDQFIRVKQGDRFWYENFQNPQAFTLQQLDEIRKTSLANIICDNADTLEVVQPEVMRRLDLKNKYVPCSAVARPNIALWKEKLESLEMNGDNSIKISTVSL